MSEAAPRLPWFPLYVDRFMGSRAVQRMTAEQVGVYLLLLVEQWRNGPIPSVEDAAFFARTDPDTARLVLGQCFEETEDGWVNATLSEVREEQLAKRERRRRAGRKGAKARWTEGENGNAMAPPMRSQSERNATPMAVEKNREEKNTTTAAAVGEFCERTGAEWRLDTPIAEWCAEIEREPKYAGADLVYEIRKCADWHVGKGKAPKAPDMSLRNWLERAAQRQRPASRSTGPQIPRVRA